MPRRQMSPSFSEHQASLKDRLKALQPYPDGRFAGRGIVICAGGASLFTCAWVLLYVLRRTLSCELPIELWCLGEEELSSGMIRLLEPFEARVVNAAAVLADYPARIVDGWQLKPYALMHSSFAEVLLLDADQVPVRDPSDVFDW